MNDMLNNPKGKCQRCNENDATNWWTGEGGVMDFVHGMAVPWCSRCCTEMQLAHAKDRAAVIPALEKTLQELGGPWTGKPWIGGPWAVTKDSK